MEKKLSGTVVRGKPAVKRVRPIPNRQIDFSDIPESTNDELQRARRVGWPKSKEGKQLIAIRLSPQLLEAIRRMAAKQKKPYQTLIHELLEKAAFRAAWEELRREKRLGVRSGSAT